MWMGRRAGSADARCMRARVRRTFGHSMAACRLALRSRGFLTEGQDTDPNSLVGFFASSLFFLRPTQLFHPAILGSMPGAALGSYASTPCPDPTNPGIALVPLRRARRDEWRWTIFGKLFTKVHAFPSPTLPSTSRRPHRFRRFRILAARFRHLRSAASLRAHRAGSCRPARPCA